MYLYIYIKQSFTQRHLYHNNREYCHNVDGLLENPKNKTKRNPTIHKWFMII